MAVTLQSHKDTKRTFERLLLQSTNKLEHILCNLTMNQHPTMNLEDHEDSLKGGQDLQEQVNDIPYLPTISQHSNPNPVLIDANIVHQGHRSAPAMCRARLPTTKNAAAKDIDSIPMSASITANIQRAMPASDHEGEQKIAMALPATTPAVTTDAMLGPFTEAFYPTSPVSNKKKHPAALAEDLGLLASPGCDSRSSQSTTTSSTASRPRKRRRTTSAHRTSWEERLRQLRDYKARYGDLLIPIRFKENPSLGKFVHNSREQYKIFHKAPGPGKPKKKKCSLTRERIEQLEELGFLWSAERSKHQKEDWEARLKQLKKYKEKYGGKFTKSSQVMILCTINKRFGHTKS